MNPLKEPDVRYKIQIVAPTPERAQELQWCLEGTLKLHGETLSEADKIGLQGFKELLTTGWLATAEDALQMFTDICDYQRSSNAAAAGKDEFDPHKD
jgi:hypothetical protein